MGIICYEYDMDEYLQTLRIALEVDQYRLPFLFFIAFLIWSAGLYTQTQGFLQKPFIVWFGSHRIGGFIIKWIVKPLLWVIFAGSLMVSWHLFWYAHDLRIKAEPHLLFDLTKVSSKNQYLNTSWPRPIYIGVRNMSSSETAEDVELTLTDFSIFPKSGFKQNTSDLLPPMKENQNNFDKKVNIHPNQTKYFQIGEEGFDENRVYYFSYLPHTSMNRTKDDNAIITLQISGKGISPTKASFYIGYYVENPQPAPKEGFSYDIYWSKAITLKPVEGYENKIWLPDNDQKAE